MKIIYQKRNYRIVEVEDDNLSMDDLKGDCYKPEVNPTIDPVELKKKEREFEQQVFDEGVFGYILEQWDYRIGQGWKTVDSCSGFVGSYSKTNDHYIISEMKQTIENELKDYIQELEECEICGCTEYLCGHNRRE